jgi:hypothetical protein
MMVVRSRKKRTRGTVNDQARKIIAAFIKRAKSGQTFTVDRVMAVINISDFRRNFSTRRVGRLLQEREDIRLVKTGLWQVVR